MSALLEHSDHQKAGRALVIVSAAYILIDQCSANFSTSGILGLNVQLTRSDLHGILGILCWLYLVIFLVRVIPNIGLDRLRSFLALRQVEAEGVKDQHAIPYTKSNSADFDWLVEQESGDISHEKLLEVQGVFSARARKRNQKKNFWERWLVNKYKCLGYLDYTLLIVAEFLVPLLFFAATALAVGPSIWPDFAISS